MKGKRVICNLSRSAVFARALSVLLFALFVLFVLAGSSCSRQTGEDDQSGSSAEFLADYSLDGVRVEEDGSPVALGKATFVGMKMTDGDFTMYYRIYIPENYISESAETAGATGKLPVLLFFHGVGERGSNNRAPLATYDGFVELFNDETSPIYNSVVIVPQCPSGEMWVDLNSAADGQYSVDDLAESTAMRSVWKLLRLYDDELELDRNRIYAMGMSMGGYATWDCLIRHTDLIAAAIPICGGCDTTKYERLIDKPIYTFHGEADPLVSVAGTREMYRLLQEAGSKKITYVEYPNEGHGIWNKAMRTAGLMDWLYAQSL